MTTTKPTFVVRWPHEGHPVPEAYRGMITSNGNGGPDAAWLEDTRDGSCVFCDGMEPEDACLGRDLDGLVAIANEEAAKVADLLAACEALAAIVDAFGKSLATRLDEQEVAALVAAQAAIARAKGGA